MLDSTMQNITEFHKIISKAQVISFKESTETNLSWLLISSQLKVNGDDALISFKYQRIYLTRWAKNSHGNVLVDSLKNCMKISGLKIRKPNIYKQFEW